MIKFIDFIKSKTFATALITIGVGIAASFGFDLPEWLTAVLVSAGLLFARNSTLVNRKVDKPVE